MLAWVCVCVGAFSSFSSFSSMFSFCECSVYFMLCAFIFIRSMLCICIARERESERASKRTNVHAKNDDPKEFLLSFHTQAHWQLLKTSNQQYKHTPTTTTSTNEKENFFLLDSCYCCCLLDIMLCIIRIHVCIHTDVLYARVNVFFFATKLMYWQSQKQYRRLMLNGWMLLLAFVVWFF